MNKKNYKRIAAVVLAATMSLGTALTAVAADPGTSTGTGSYEGGALKYPTLSVTLPTIPDKTYDYIADPNGLIAATSNAKYSGATFTGTTGVFFKTTDNTYTEKSAAQELTNANAQDIDVKVKLEVETAGDESIQFANSATFDAGDKANKIYLAITDDAQESPKVAALSADGAATVMTTVEGVPGNYEPNYDASGGGYGYKLKGSGTTDWNKCSFILTGAINKNATWGDNVTFPSIKVTWSYEEHVDAIDAVGSLNAGVIWMSVDGTNGFPARPTSVTVDGSPVSNYTVSSSNWVSMANPGAGKVILITVGDTIYRVIAP